MHLAHNKPFTTCDKRIKIHFHTHTNVTATAINNNATVIKAISITDSSNQHLINF